MRKKNVPYSTGGALKSPKDKRDYKISKLINKNAAALPTSARCPIPPIIANQKEVGCCVGCTLAQIKHFQEYAEAGDKEMFSAAYIYANREDEDFQGSGMYPREALKNLKKYGMCHNKDFPAYADKEYPELYQDYILSKEDLDKKALPFHIASYYALETLEDIKTVISTIGYCQICYPVFKCFYFPDEQGLIHYNPFLRGKNYGGHSVTCIGYDDNRQALLIANSWGKEYGKGGCIWVPYNYPFSEAWAIIDAKTEEYLLDKGI